VDSYTEEVLEFKKIRAAIAEKTACALGRERVLERPVTAEADEIEREYAYARELYRLFDLNQEPPTEGLRDVRPILRRVAIQGVALEPAQMMEIADFCALASRVKRFFAQAKADAPRLADEAEKLVLLHDVEYFIRKSIDPGGEVSDNASERLRELRGKIRALEAQIQRTLERLVRALDDADILQDDFITQRQGRYVLPVKAGQKGKINGIVHDASHSGETFFIEPFAVVEMTNDLTGLRVEAREEIRKILKALGDLVREELPAFDQNVALLAEVDERLARARFGYERQWVIPRWHTSNRPPVLHGAHHPLLQLQSPDTSIPLDLPLGEDDHALIISGPNAGGKTTALKTVGLLTIMFQSSMPVPVHPDSTFRIFHRVLADIGDEQDVTSGLSTFSSHVRRISQMLKNADESTLVLIDELGTATDPTEGGALAVAVVETLLERHCLILVTSHLALLKSWAESHDQARNASFFLDPRTHRPTFRMRLDVPGVSEALVIAQQMGLDEAIIRRAYDLLPEGVYDLNKILVRLEERERLLAAELGEAAKRERAAREQLQKAEREREELQEQRRNLRHDFVEEKENWLRDVRQRIEEQIAKLPSREAVVEAKREVQGLQERVKAERASIDRVAPFAPTVFDRLQPGRRVRVEMLHDEGEVVDVDRDRQRVLVAVRNMQIELTPDQVKLIDETERPAMMGKGYRAPAREALSPEIELHGLRVEEALERVDKHIEKALRHDFAQVRLRHGRGTGALRRAIHDFLRTHQSVKSFRAAEQDQGGDGVTVAELK
jgi:DNA mismatch repair protein MutS2